MCMYVLEVTWGGGQTEEDRMRFSFLKTTLKPKNAGHYNISAWYVHKS